MINNLLGQVGAALNNGGGPPGLGGYAPGNAVINNAQMQANQANLLAQQRAGRNINAPANIQQMQQRNQQMANVMAGHDAMAGFLAAVAGQGANRNIPAYNRNEQEGRTALVDAAALGHGTQLPVPFSRQYDLMSNYRAYATSIPQGMYQASEDIVRQVESMHPLAQEALKQDYTIYEKVPQNFLVNRVNLALQRKRENSLYAVV